MVDGLLVELLTADRANLERVVRLLEGISDTEEKLRLIGEELIRVFEDEVAERVTTESVEAKENDVEQ